jgi:predicted amidohydrolase
MIGVQFDIAWEDRSANFAKVSAMLAKSPPQRGAMVVLPEMFGSGFSMNLDRTAEGDERQTESFLAGLARQYAGYVVGGLAILGEDGRGRNLAVVAGPDGNIVARYAKIHPYTMGKEAEHFSGGDKVVTFAAGEYTIAPFVCYDLRFPEIFRVSAARGAQVMVVIANWPAARVEHWTTLLRARAIENQTYVIGVNRCGNDPYLAYPGRSMIFDFKGNLLADAGGGEGIIAADVDAAALQQWRREMPALVDIRKEFFPTSS